MNYRNFNELVDYLNNSAMCEEEIYYQNLREDVKFRFSNFVIKFFSDYKHDTIINHISYSFDDIIPFIDGFVCELNKLYRYIRYIRKMDLNEEVTIEVDKVVDFINNALRRVEILMYLAQMEISSNTKDLIETSSKILVDNVVGLKNEDGSWNYDSCVKTFINNIEYLFKLAQEDFYDNVLINIV